MDAGGRGTHLLNEVDGGLKVESKVDEGPVDALHPVLLLLQDEHGVVEQLLQLLVRVIDTQLLEGVELWTGEVGEVNGVGLRASCTMCHMTYM